MINNRVKCSIFPTQFIFSISVLRWAKGRGGGVGALPDLQGAGPGGAPPLLYGPAGSGLLLPQPPWLPWGLPQAEVPLSTAWAGEAGSPHGGSGLEWTLGRSPQPGGKRTRAPYQHEAQKQNGRRPISTGATDTLAPPQLDTAAVI